MLSGQLWPSVTLIKITGSGVISIPDGKSGRVPWAFTRHSIRPVSICHVGFGNMRPQNPQGTSCSARWSLQWVIGSIHQNCTKSLELFNFTLSVTNLPKKPQGPLMQVGCSRVVPSRATDNGQIVEGVSLPMPVAELLVYLLGPLVQVGRSRVVPSHATDNAQMMECMGLPMAVTELLVYLLGPLEQVGRSRVVPSHATDNAQMMECMGLSEAVTELLVEPPGPLV
jgi:hypothetical protein